MSSHDSNPDPATIRRALGALRAKVDKQQAVIAEGFQNLRAEIDLLDRQVQRLERAPTVEGVASAAPSPLDPPDLKIVPADAEKHATDQQVPVGKVVTGVADAIPVVTVEVEASPTVEDGDFRASSPSESVAASEFDFSGTETKSAVEAAEPVNNAPEPFGPPSEEVDMELVMFGPELAANQSLSDTRQALIQGLYAGAPDALTLMGVLLVFRGASADRMPGLLKEVGEAYYRWRPESADRDDDFREELMGWLQRKCDEAGCPNTIELVLPGDRYDSKRHHAKDRGVEVDQVRGWVVLRDNGRVYTKASVTLK